MCGILGIVTSPGRESRVARHDLLAMRDCMAARGLNSGSILQRSNLAFAVRLEGRESDSRQTQPLISPNERLVVVFDGEFHNREELRQELTRIGFHFRTETDAEVLLHAWTAWGKSCIRKLQGTFAFAVVDAVDCRVWLVRDRVGARPLFYWQSSGEFVFASSLKAIKRHPEFSAAPNFAVVRHYLSTLRLTLDDQTIFENCHTVLPAEIVTLVNGKVQREKYWSLDQPVLAAQNYQEAVEELDEQVCRSIRSNLEDLKGTGSVGVLLTGGVDSSTLSSIANEQTGKRLHSRCGGMSESATGPLTGSTPNAEKNDFFFAEKVAREKRFHHRSIALNNQQFLESWRQLISDYGSPLSVPNEVLLFQVAKSFTGEASVLLAADGIDEAFCGYSIPHWAANDFERANFLAKIHSDEADQARESLRRQYGRDFFYSPSDHFMLTSGLIPRNTLSSLMRPETWLRADQERVVERYYDKQFDGQANRPIAEQYTQLLFQLNLTSSMERLDRAASQAGIQARAPYTDHRLLEHAFRLPQNYKIDLAPSEKQPWLSSMELENRKSIRSKRIFRSVASRWVRGDIASRPKQSAPTSVPQWLGNQWEPWIESTLSESPFANELFDSKMLHQLQGLPQELAMWKWPILNLAIWGDQQFM